MDAVYLGEDGSSTTFSCDRQGTPDLRLLHYNDVYHVECVQSSPPSGQPASYTQLTVVYGTEKKEISKTD